MAEKMSIRNNIIIPGIENDLRVHELRGVLEVCSDEKIKKVVEEEKEEEERKTKEREEKKLELMWNTNAILDDLKENHVKIEKNKKIMWYKWKIVHIDLPAIWNFNWFKFNYFVSYERVVEDEFERNFLFGDQLYSMKDVSELLQAMNEYMKELQGKNDWDMDYEDKLKYRTTNTCRCNIWDYLKYITWLDSIYWLKYKIISWMESWCIRWHCDYDHCFFRPNSDLDSGTKLFLRLS